MGILTERAFGRQEHFKQDSKVFVGGLSWETDSDKLRAYFENFGVVQEAFVSVNQANGRPRGFGFVTFEKPEVARKVIATKHTIDRREVEAKESFAREEQSTTGRSSSDGAGMRSKKLFVGGLPAAVDDAVLRQHFEIFGAVETAEVMLDHETKRPRGFGFVTFASEECVEKVFEQGSPAHHTILDKQVEVKPAMPRDQMQNQMPLQFMARGHFDNGYQGMARSNGMFYPACGQIPQFQGPPCGLPSGRHGAGYFGGPVQGQGFQQQPFSEQNLLALIAQLHMGQQNASVASAAAPKPPPFQQDSSVARMMGPSTVGPGWSS